MSDFEWFDEVLKISLINMFLSFCLFFANFLSQFLTEFDETRLKSKLMTSAISIWSDYAIRGL